MGGGEGGVSGVCRDVSGVGRGIEWTESSIFLQVFVFCTLAVSRRLLKRDLSKFAFVMIIHMTH